MMSALASILEADDLATAERLIEEGVPDPVGLFYRFSLAGSLLRRRARPTPPAGGTP
jgi:F420-non-reducing hydrogenase small subunit